MARGTVKAPARAGFEFAWFDDEKRLRVDPRVASIRTVDNNVAGSEGHCKVQIVTYGQELVGEDVAEHVVLKAYQVHPDGTIFVCDVGGTRRDLRGGVVIAPVLDDPSSTSCHMAWIEVVANSTSHGAAVAAWASKRLSFAQGKMMAEVVRRMSRLVLNKIDVAAIVRRGAVVNCDGVSGGSEIYIASTSDDVMERKKREHDGMGMESKIQSVQLVLDFVKENLPEGRANVRAELADFSRLLLVDAFKRQAVRECSASYPYDALMHFILLNFPTEEAWVEELVEQVSMRVVEEDFRSSAAGGGGSRGYGNAGGGGGGGLSGGGDPSLEAGSRISAYMGKEKDRAPSL
jgi:uncharacterized membrane protein YgcG